MNPTLPQLNSGHNPNWCPGCGNYSILMAVKNVLVRLGRDPKDVVITTGIGCSSKFNHYVKTYGFESIHGRGLPVSTGIKLANHKLTVINVGGDGDGYGIGLNHFLQIMRRNIDLTYIVTNNQVYGLTKGQTSPTSEKGFVTKSTPFGNLEEPLNPLPLAITMGATYVSRGFAGEIKHLEDLILGGLNHRGFSLIDVFQPCVVWNHLNTYEWFKKRVYKLEETDYKTNDKSQAWEKSHEIGNKIPIGLFYQEKRETYEDGLPSITKKALVEHDINNIDISKSIEEFV